MEYAINRLSLIKPQYKNFFGFSQIDVFEKYLNTKKSREKTKKSEQLHGINVHILECMHGERIYLRSIWKICQQMWYKRESVERWTLSI